MKSKEEVRLYNKKYYLENKQELSIKRAPYQAKYHQDHKEKKIAQQNNYRLDARYQMVYNAKTRAKKLGIPHDLHYTDLVIPELCPVLGILLSKGVDGRHDGSPSIDRVHNHLGYIKGNVAVISWKANKMKSDMTIGQLRSLVFYMEQYDA